MSQFPFAKARADELRAVFGAEGIDAEIRKGNYYINENGVERGKRWTGPTVSAADMVLTPMPRIDKKTVHGR